MQNQQHGWRSKTDIGYTHQTGEINTNYTKRKAGLFQAQLSRTSIDITTVRTVKQSREEFSRPTNGSSRFRGETVAIQNGDFFLTSRELAQDRNENSKMAGQTSIDTHPA